MAFSSTSFVQKSFKYDVFLSFTGKDTAKTFVDHLYHALEQKGIHTYKEDERIKKGERIACEILKSLEESRFYIIVFSRNYATSSWCLDELVKIMECQKMSYHTAYPVFYDVECIEVRKQRGEFGNAIAKHEKELEMVERWKEALKEASSLAGWELKNTLDGEAKFIKKIVEEISLELRSINVDIDEELVGMETRIRGVVSSLEMGFDDVRMIGIKGMRGSGKTTLARAVFDHISIRFEGSSFVENVREVSATSLYGLKKLQKQVLKDVFNDDRSIKISNVHEGKKMLKKMMRCIKVLVVLDDVDNIHQLEALAGERNWFQTGSRIIITTRDEQPLVAHRINSILYATLLSNREALCLFSRHAFEKEIPIQGYEELSEQVVIYAGGLPLALTYLGSFLCGKNKLEWKNVIRRLKTFPLKDNFDILEIKHSFKYDVFLSFRGEDTRKTFVDHLYHALHQKSIHTYKDDERIGKGKQISDELLESIEDSKFYIIVFSKNYASSSWCLDELVKIMGCQKTIEHTAYPIFYDVEPTEVRNQSGEFGIAFAKQEKEEAAQKWRETLIEASTLAGWELKNTLDGYEAKFIQKVVDEISRDLCSIT